MPGSSLSCASVALLMSRSSALAVSAALAWAKTALGVKRTERTASRIKRAKRVMGVSLAVRGTPATQAQEDGRSEEERRRDQLGVAGPAADVAAAAAAVAPAAAGAAAAGERLRARAGAGDTLGPGRAGDVAAGIVGALALVA